MNHRHHATRRREKAHPTPSRTVRPMIEGLEDRRLLSTLDGGQWAYGSRITYSFMPDGTNIGGTPSNLFSSFNARFPTATWEQAFQKAFSVWEAVTNINLAQVSDNGAPDGSAGNQQGDPNFGDIRIGAVPMDPGTLASTFLPPPINGGSNAGDIIINSNQPWQINSNFDIETVAIHEIGHALGLGHSAIASADMYAFYNGVKQSTTSDDSTGIQSIYGLRQRDYFASTYNNILPFTAAPVSQYINGNNQVVLPGLDIGGFGAEWFKVTVPANNVGSMTVVMQSSNLSSLSPQLTIFDGRLHGLVQSSAPNSFGATVGLVIPNVQAGQTYYVATSAAQGYGGVGGYGLQFNFGSVPLSPFSPPNTVVAAQPDQGGGSTNLNVDMGSVGTASVNSQPVSAWAGGGLLGDWVTSLWGLLGNLPGFAQPSGHTVSVTPRSGDAPSMIHIGTLWGYGETLTVAPSSSLVSSFTATSAVPPVGGSPFGAGGLFGDPTSSLYTIQPGTFNPAPIAPPVLPVSGPAPGFLQALDGVFATWSGAGSGAHGKGGSFSWLTL